MTPQEIKEMREALGDTQAQLARRLRVATETVNLWENGVHQPSKMAGKRLASLKRSLVKP